MKNPVNDQKPKGEIQRHPRYPQLILPRALAGRLMRGGEFQTKRWEPESGITHRNTVTRPTNKYSNGLGFRVTRTKRK